MAYEWVCREEKEEGNDVIIILKLKGVIKIKHKRNNP